MSRQHEIKEQTIHFNDVISKKKTFEVRYNDRDYQVGDTVLLMDYDEDSYTGRTCEVEIIYLTSFAQKDDWVVFGFEILDYKWHK